MKYAQAVWKAHIAFEMINLVNCTNGLCNEIGIAFTDPSSLINHKHTNHSYFFYISGERLIQYATENLVTEVLIHPQMNTLLQCLRNLLSSFTRHRHIIHAGYTFAGNGSWIMQVSLMCCQIDIRFILRVWIEAYYLIWININRITCASDLFDPSDYSVLWLLSCGVFTCIRLIYGKFSRE